MAVSLKIHVMAEEYSTMGPSRMLANEGLHQLGQALRNKDCFDNEDMEFWQEEVTRFKEVDKELLALQEHLPERQRYLSRLDEQFGLTQYFPTMMKKFAAKDAELQTLLDEKLRQHQQDTRSNASY